MTDEEREKFDAIRMNLELTGHDLESMRERVERLNVACEANRVACEVNRVACEELRRTAESHEHQFRDIREDLLLLQESAKSLLVVSRSNERRLEKLEGRTQ